MTPREFAFAPITIDATDVTTVMTTTRGVDIAGRIVFEGDAKPPLRDVRLQVVAQRDNDAQFYMNLPTPMAPVQADLTFEVSRLYGPVILRLQGLPEGWIVRSVRYGQVDIVDATTEFAQGAESRNVEVIATNRTTQLTARPVEDNGQPATNAVVLLVPRDPARWKGGLFSAILRSRKDGTVLFPPRLPGEYFIMAVPAEDVARVSRSTDLLRSLTERAQRITLRENEHPAIDVRVLRLSGSR